MHKRRCNAINLPFRRLVTPDPPPLELDCSEPSSSSCSFIESLSAAFFSARHSRVNVTTWDDEVLNCHRRANCGYATISFESLDGNQRWLTCFCTIKEVAMERILMITNCLAIKTFSLALEPIVTLATSLTLSIKVSLISNLIIDCNRETKQNVCASRRDGESSRHIFSHNSSLYHFFGKLITIWMLPMEFQETSTNVNNSSVCLRDVRFPIFFSGWMLTAARKLETKTKWCDQSLSAHRPCRYFQLDAHAVHDINLWSSKNKNFSVT